MPPEQRLTVREAVEMIARHGAAPISESALRARIRNRKIGVVRANGRIYTNPLNLVTAGLLPVEVLSTGAGEIDDAELHAWLNPDEPTPPADSKRAAAAPSEQDDIVAPTPETNTNREVGPLERALSGAGDRETRDRTFSPPSHAAGDRIRRRPAGGQSNCTDRRLARRRAAALAGVGIAVAGAAMIAIGPIASDPAASRVAQIRPPMLVSSLDAEPPVKRIARALRGGDYVRALNMASLSRDPALLVRTQRSAADAVLARADRARKAGQLDQARRDVRTVSDAFGDPRPSATAVVSARIARDARSARLAREQRASAAPSESASGAQVTGSPPAATTAKPPAESPDRAQATASSPAQRKSSGGSAAKAVSKSKPKDEDTPVEPDFF